MYDRKFYEEPHAHIQGHIERGYGHVKCYVSLNSDKAFTHDGSLIVNSQIGTDHDFSIRGAILDADERSYAHRVEIDASSDGATAAHLKRMGAILARFEKAREERASRTDSLASMMLDLMVAARVRFVFLNDDVIGRNGVAYRAKDQCRLMDLRSPSDVIEVGRVVAKLRDSIWEELTPLHRRNALAEEMEAKDRAAA